MAGLPTARWPRTTRRDSLRRRTDEVLRRRGWDSPEPASRRTRNPGRTGRVGRRGVAAGGLVSITSKGRLKNSRRTGSAVLRSARLFFLSARAAARIDRRREAVRRARRRGSVALLRSVADAGRAAADDADRNEVVCRTHRGGSVAVLGDVAASGHGTTGHARGRERVGRTGALRTAAGLGHVAGARCRPACATGGTECVGRALRGRSRTGLRGITAAGCRSAGRLECAKSVVRTGLRRTIAELRRVAAAGGRAAGLVAALRNLARMQLLRMLRIGHIRSVELPRPGWRCSGVRRVLAQEIPVAAKDLPGHSRGPVDGNRDVGTVRAPACRARCERDSIARHCWKRYAGGPESETWRRRRVSTWDICWSRGWA